MEVRGLGPLAEILSTYDRDDNFNTDETGLFQQNATVFLKGDECGEKSRNV